MTWTHLGWYRLTHIKTMALCVLLGALPLSASGQSAQNIPPADQEWIEYLLAGMLDYCKDEQPVDCDLSEVKLDLEDDAIFRMPYKADGTEATVFVERRVSCTNVGSFGSITGNTTSYIIVDGVLFETWGAVPSYTVVHDYDALLIVIPRSGSVCEYDEDIGLSNASSCFTVAVWDEYSKTFNSIDGAIKLSKLNP